MIELLGFISYLITLYTYVVIANVILSWLMAFGVVNPYNPTVRAIWQALNALVEPLLRPIRNVMPNLGADRHLAHRPAPGVLLRAERGAAQHRQALRVMGPVRCRLGVRRAWQPRELPWRTGTGCVIVRVRLTPKSSIEGVGGVGPTAEGPAFSGARARRSGRGRGQRGAGAAGGALARRAQEHGARHARRQIARQVAHHQRGNRLPRGAAQGQARPSAG